MFNPIVILFISAILLILSMGHFVVYKTVQTVFSIQSGPMLFSIRIAFILLTFSFVVATILASNYNNIFTRIFYTCSAIWLGFLFCFFVASCLYGIIATTGALTKTGGFYPGIGKLLFLLAALAGIYSLWHATSIKLRTLETNFSNLPPAWYGRQAVWVSDWHIGQVHGASYSDKIIKKVNSLNPDIVFIGGDLFDGTKVDFEAVTKSLRQLHPKLGTFFITGNHEEFGDREPFLKAVREAGIQILNNERVKIDGMQIIGVDDHDSSDKKIFRSVLEKINIEQGVASVMLKHQPNHLDLVADKGVNLVISGHTHRAQMFPLSLLPQLVYGKYSYGSNSINSTATYTSSGVGTWGPPMRIGTDSEILIIRFK